MNIVEHNRVAWDNQSRQQQSPWVQPVSPAEIEAAKAGHWQVILTPTKAVPKDWFGDLRNKEVLGLASGGGQQVPIFAAAGANVTSFDNSAEQLNKDLLVAQREGLHVTLEQGDMADLSRFGDATFDLIFHPVSNVFSEHILPVWAHCARVLKPGGRLLSGFMNPDFFSLTTRTLIATALLKCVTRCPSPIPSTLAMSKSWRGRLAARPWNFLTACKVKSAVSCRLAFYSPGFMKTTGIPKRPR